MKIMKKLVSAILAVTLLLTMVPAMSLSTAAASESDLTFTVYNGEVFVWKCSPSASGTLVIPSTYNGAPVTGIADNAFADCSSLTGVTIPNGVTSIGDGAFADCSSLTRVTIPGSVTRIGRYAFSNCVSLTSITLPDGVTKIDNYAFRGCTRLTGITLPNSVTDIGKSVFLGCNQSLTIFANMNSYARKYASTNDITFMDLAVKTVNDMILALGEITLEDKADIEAARAAYNALTTDQKALVEKLDVLVAAEDKLAELEQAAAEKAEADAKAAADVDAMILALGEITLEDKADIEAARSAYNALTADQKALVEKLDVLVAAENKLAELEQAAAAKAEADAKAAADVDAMILALGEITLEDKADIEAARAAYDALTDDQKKLVTNLDTLVKAEKAIEELKDSYAPGDVDGDGTINVSDIIKVKNLIMAGVWSDAELVAGDMNNSGKLDVADIIAIKNLIMGA